MPCNSIGSRICELRTSKGLSQAELAKKLYVKRETIAQWEADARDIKTNHTVALADFFNVTCDYILGRTDCKTHEAAAIGDVTGLSELAIERIKQINNMGLSDILSRMIFDANFTSAIYQMNKFISLKLRSGYHAIVPNADFKLLQNGGEGEAMLVTNYEIERIFVVKAKEDFSKVVEEVMTEFKKVREAERNGKCDKEGE